MPRVVALIFLLSVSAAAQTAAPEQWVKYDFDEGAVSISSPIKLRAVEMPLPSDVPIQKVVTYRGLDSGRVFALTCTVLKDDSEKWAAAQRENFYIGIWEGVQTSLKKTINDGNLGWTIQLNEMKAVTISGRVGRQIGYSFGPYKGTIRAIVFGKRSYVAAIVSLPELHAQLSERYLNSFAITPAVPAKGARIDRGRSLWA